MKNLIEQRSELAQAKFEEALANARQFAKKARADSTWRAYQGDWRQFERWCREVELPALPAEPKTLVAFLGSQAAARKSPATIQRRMVAIRLVHIGAGLPWPDADKAVAELMQGIRRDWARPPNRKAPAIDTEIKRMVNAVEPESAKGLRDRALLLFGFAGAFRRSELVALQIEDLSFQDEGVKVTIRQSKTDQAAQGQTIAIPSEDASEYCPLLALKDWVTVAAIESGPIFLRMHRHDVIGSKPMSPQSVALVIKHYAAAVGLDPRRYAGHSLRRGFLTSAAKKRRDLLKMAEQSRHKTLDVVRQYIEDEAKFEDHAGEGLLK